MHWLRVSVGRESNQFRVDSKDPVSFVMFAGYFVISFRSLSEGQRVAGLRNSTVAYDPTFPSTVYDCCSVDDAILTKGFRDFANLNCRCYDCGSDCDSQHHRFCD